jgi:type II secretory pathway pseudopilin PulG
VPSTPLIPARTSEAGFSLVEALVSLGIFLVVSTVVMGAMLSATNSQAAVWNRTAMHSGVRSATEVLQQEVGQAGRPALPGTVALTAAVAAAGSATVGVSSVAGMFTGEQLTIDAGASQETVALTAVNAGTNQITAVFADTHTVSAAVAVFGGFASGIVPPTLANGSTATVLKLYGDVNSDGNMVYVEYTCDTVAGNLYRNVMAFDAAAKPALTASQVLLGGLKANPSGTPCFAYQTQVVGANTYVTDVAITLTVQTAQRDPITQLYQTETKALLNVSPRNVFNTWAQASLGITNRIQPMPPTVATLIH